MSRDHYKGTPKTRDARVLSDGTIKPLNYKNIAGPLKIDKLIASAKSAGMPVKVIRARSTGDDQNGDGSLENPFKTFKRCCEEIPAYTVDEKLFIDISDLGTEVLEEPFYFPATKGTRTYEAATGSALALKSTFYDFESSLHIYAEPTVIQEFTKTGSSADTTTSRQNVTLAGAGWTPDEHKGRFLLGASIADFAVIVGNTEDTLTITATSNVGDDLVILEPSATLSYGYTSNPSGTLLSGPFSMTEVEGNYQITGVAFKSNGPGDVARFYTDGKSRINFCTFDDYAMFVGPGDFYVKGCHFKHLDHSAGFTEITNSFLDASTFRSTSTGRLTLLKSTLIGCGRVGSDTVYNRDRPHPNMYVENCTMVSGTEMAFAAYGAVRCFIGYCDISDNAGDAIYVDRGTNCVVRYCTGTGNTGYGVNADNGALVEIRDSTVTGSSGDFKVGVLLDPSDWASFEAAGNMVDVFAVSGTLTRMKTV